MKKKIDVHPKVPAALKRDLKMCDWNLRALARLRDVNPYWVNRLVRKGIEPTNKVTRLKLSLPARRRKPHVPGPPKPPVPEWECWWRRLSKEEREKIKISEYEGFKYEKENKP